MKVSFLFVYLIKKNAVAGIDVNISVWKSKPPQANIFIFNISLILTIHFSRFQKNKKKKVDLTLCLKQKEERIHWIKYWKCYTIQSANDINNKVETIFPMPPNNISFAQSLNIAKHRTYGNMNTETVFDMKVKHRANGIFNSFVTFRMFLFDNVK